MELYQDKEAKLNRFTSHVQKPKLQRQY